MVIRVLLAAATMLGGTSLISLDAHAQDAARAGQLQSAVDYIGSKSKQFPATAILLFQQEGKLSLDDSVSRSSRDSGSSSRMAAALAR